MEVAGRDHDAPVRSVLHWVPRQATQLALLLGALPLVPDGQHRANQRCEGSHDCENDREV